MSNQEANGMRRVVVTLAATWLLANVGCAPSTGAVAPAGYYHVPAAAAGLAAMRPETHAPASSTPYPQGTASIYLPGALKRSNVRYQIVDGMAVYHGDVLLGPAHLVATLYAAPRVAAPAEGAHYATAHSASSLRWPGGVIPYEIDASAAGKRPMIDWAVATVSGHSVVKLRPRTFADQDYVVFTQLGANNCSSYVGRIGGPQPIHVAGCTERGSVVHEIGHAAGLFHEQERADRDAYVTIVWSEISPGFESEFEIHKETVDLGAYDYGSIMHYSRGAYSKSGNPTIVPKVPNAVIGQREALSPGDAAGLAALYGGGVLPGPTPVPVLPAPAPGAVAAGGFAGTYTSTRGDVVCGQLGAAVNCSYAGGSLACAATGARLDCGWFGASGGRATFTQQANGNLSGSYGAMLSDSDQGGWELVRATSAPATIQIPGFPEIPGLPAIPGLPTLPTALPIGPLPPELFQIPPLPPELVPTLPSGATPQ